MTLDDFGKAEIWRNGNRLNSIGTYCDYENTASGDRC